MPNTEEAVADVNTTATQETKQTGSFASVADALLEIERLRNINKEVIETRDKTKERLKTFEQEAEDRVKKTLEEQGKYKEMYEVELAKRTATESAIKERELNTTLRSELAKVNALSIDTVLKLVDKSAVEFNDDGTVKVDSVAKIIKELRKSDPILFGSTEAPSAKRAGDGDNANTFESDIRKAKTQKDVNAVLQKYGKLK